MSGRTYNDGRINGIRFAVTWLHERANEMNDPHARALLNSAAFWLGSERRREATGHGIAARALLERDVARMSTSWPEDSPSGNGETETG